MKDGTCYGILGTVVLIWLILVISVIGDNGHPAAAQYPGGGGGSGGPQPGSWGTTYYILSGSKTYSQDGPSGWHNVTVPLDGTQAGMPYLQVYGGNSSYPGQWWSIGGYGDLNATYDCRASYYPAAGQTLDTTGAHQYYGTISCTATADASSDQNLGPPLSAELPPPTADDGLGDGSTNTVSYGPGTYSHTVSAGSHPTLWQCSLARDSSGNPIYVFQTTIHAHVHSENSNYSSWHGFCSIGFGCSHPTLN